jgi:formylglycine-generating enzyme required for sulfatase activity
MVSVPAGEFRMGTPESNLDAPPEEKPEHAVTLKAFRIDRFETTNGEYRRFLDAVRPGHPVSCAPQEPTGKEHAPGALWWADPEWNAPEKPVIGVDWYDAYAYCAWAGKRLPTEAEWEKAARGTDGRKYAWGDEIRSSPLVGNFADEAALRVNPSWRVLKGYDDGFAHTAPVGSFPAGAGPYGMEDAAGNVWEWVADYYSPAAYKESPPADPRGPSEGTLRVLRGGSWDSTPNLLRAAVRHVQSPLYRGISAGIRCAQDAP